MSGVSKKMGLTTGAMARLCQSFSADQLERGARARIEAASRKGPVFLFIGSSFQRGDLARLAGNCKILTVFCGILLNRRKQRKARHGTADRAESRQQIVVGAGCFLRNTRRSLATFTDGKSGEDSSCPVPYSLNLSRRRSTHS